VATYKHVKVPSEGQPITVDGKGAPEVPHNPIVPFTQGDGTAVFEVTHGTAPKYAGLDEIDPGSVILSGARMLDYIGGGEVRDAIFASMERTIGSKMATCDPHRQMKGATLVSCCGFGDELIENL
jgi:isocitrate dehydrogenase